jgi:DNA modification methylase
MASVHHQDDWLTVWSGDCRDAMQQMAEGSVQTVITSPPYYGLRDYGLEGQVWGGDPEHPHVWDAYVIKPQSGGVGASTLGEASGGNGISPEGMVRSQERQQRPPGQASFCECGAWLGALGLEPSPGLYIEHLVEVFRGIWRVLRDDGVAWLNLGDSYARVQDTNVPQTKNKPVAYPEVSNFSEVSKKGSSDGAVGRADRPGSRAKMDGLKAKDLIGIPWMAAFALRDDGWYLRQDIVWAKPNAMPESVEDRPTRSHEFIFMLTKQPRYFFDHTAIKEPVGEAMQAAAKRAPTDPDKTYQHDADSRMGKTSPNRVWSDPAAVARIMQGRNKRDVWTVPTAPYPGAHYAVFPPALVEPMVLSSSSEKGSCVECGAPYKRVLDVESYPAEGRDQRPNLVPGQGSGQQSGNYWTPPTITEVGWAPTCTHEAIPNERLDPCVVFDPFGGSGTVAMVAQKWGRRAVLVDLNPDYIDQQLKRNINVPLGL